VGSVNEVSVNYKRIIILLLVGIFIANNQDVFAQLIDLGVEGDVFEIKEPDMREWIKNKAKNFDFVKLQNELTDKVTNFKPKGFEISRAIEYKTHYYNPEVVLTEPLFDHKGNILKPAGYRDNPLNYFSFTQTLVFFDGNDEKQLKYAFDIEAQKDNVVLIEVNGDVLGDIKKYKKSIFFANQNLVDKLQIQRVPSMAYQEGMMIRIDEVKLD
jgi:conjugal transfer pilus assembly protein TraW